MSKIKLIDSIETSIKNNWQTYKSLNAKGKRKWWGEFLLKNAIYIIIFLFVIYVQIYTTLDPQIQNSFLEFKSIIDILKRASAAMFLALGVGGIIVLTGTDLSAGRIMGFVACICASLLQTANHDHKMFPNLSMPPIFLVLLLAVITGAAFGVFNGFCVSKFKLHPFIVTLATQLMLCGIMLMYVGINGGGSISGLSDEYSNFVKGDFKFVRDLTGVVIPYYVYYAIIAVVIMWFIWNKTTLGKNMYAVGANPEAANVSGISVMATTILIFTIAGCYYGFSGFIESARVVSNNPSTGLNKELDAIAACVIGGVSFTGGLGKVSGIVVGVILLQIVDIGLQWVGLAGNMTYVIKGAIILIAVAIDMRKYLAKK